jgi:hypothetical protein
MGKIRSFFKRKFSMAIDADLFFFHHEALQSTILEIVSLKITECEKKLEILLKIKASENKVRIKISGKE